MLVKSCYKCHSADAKDLGGKPRLDHRDGLTRGRRNRAGGGSEQARGQPADPGVEHRDGLEMPPDKKLPSAVVQDFRKWIAQGAVDPRVSSTKPKPGSNTPPAAPGPVVAEGGLTSGSATGKKFPGWPQTDIDRFLLARMEAADLTPVADASPETLLRRVTSTWSACRQHPNSWTRSQPTTFPAAYGKIVDELLASPLSENAGPGTGWTWPVSPNRPAAAGTC
ncbi:MAG: hypothetical protein CM1200mP2_35850 [Planctomycetaceae bacterium]|nr:MAG: hypothetical protein CM1200mP2_35850 [Planctomycetaceae bacterium]